MRCPFCGSVDDKVVDSRPSDDDLTVRRRRECLMCGRRFTTYERIESVPLVVIKKDGSRQPFDRNKLIGGILKSCEKRKVTYAQIEGIVNALEGSQANKLRQEISSREIGEFVMAKLKVIDEVAYIRFASVYKDFSDVNSFLAELKKLVPGEKGSAATISDAAAETKSDAL